MKINEGTAGFNYEDQIRFTRAVFYNFRTIPLPKPFRDATGGMGVNIPENTGRFGIRASRVEMP